MYKWHVGVPHTKFYQTISAQYCFRAKKTDFPRTRKVVGAIFLSTPCIIERLGSCIILRTVHSGSQFLLGFFKASPQTIFFRIGIAEDNRSVESRISRKVTLNIITFIIQCMELPRLVATSEI